MAAAILDIDGTLVDTNYHHAVAWFRAFRTRGLTLPLWRIHRHIGMGGDQLVAALAGEGFDRELEKADTAPTDAVMVGDSTWDCRAAKAAKVRSIGVLTGGFGDTELRDEGASEVFPSVDDLRASLDDTVLRV